MKYEKLQQEFEMNLIPCSCRHKSLNDCKNNGYVLKQIYEGERKILTLYRISNKGSLHSKGVARFILPNNIIIILIFHMIIIRKMIFPYMALKIFVLEIIISD